MKTIVRRRPTESSFSDTKENPFSYNTKYKTLCDKTSNVTQASVSFHFIKQNCFKQKIKYHNIAAW